MFEPITGLPTGVIGFEAVGTIEAADYEDVLIPAIARAAEAGGVRLVFVLGDRFTGYSPGAMKEDAGLVAHASAWKRTALVSDLGWVAHLSTAVRLDGARQVQAVRTCGPRCRSRLGRRTRMTLPLAAAEWSPAPDAESPPAIRIRGLAKRFGAVEAVRGHRPRGPTR